MVEAYKSSLKVDPVNESIMLKLARIHLVRENLADATALCETLLRIEPGGADATMVLADVAFVKGDMEAAGKYLRKVRSVRS